MRRRPNLSCSEHTIFDHTVSDHTVSDRGISANGRPSIRPVFGVIISVMALIAATTIAGSTANAMPTQQTCPDDAVTVDLALGQLPTDGDDVIRGTSGDDAIAAGGGDDIVCGMGGNDSIWGQAGNDRIWGGLGDDRIRGGAGDDHLYGGEGSDDLNGGSGNDEVRGQDGDDERVRGGTGDDLVAGGRGNDPLVAGNGGSDIVRGGSGDDKITGGPRPDTLYGGNGNDTALGHKGADIIFGEGGDDDLRGGQQPDMIDGGVGVDICNGGTTGNGAAESDTATACETELNVEGADQPDPEHAPDPRPGAGVSVSMMRANWASGYMQAQVVHNLAEELGYDVSDPSLNEADPDLAYDTIARGDSDFWVNSWMPGHLSWLQGPLPDGTVRADHVTVTGDIVPGGGTQGYLISSDFAAAYGLTTLDDLNANLNGALIVYDQSDAVPNNGKAEIFGCEVYWTCDDIINSQITFSNWANIEQVTATYDMMAAEAVRSFTTSVPTVIYTWTPTSYIAQFAATNNASWIAPAETLDASNPLGIDGGESFDQGDGTGHPGGLPCLRPAQANVCQMGWASQTIRATANTAFFEREPAIASLLDSVQIPVLDAAVASIDLDRRGAEAVAAEWIENNRALVDRWLGAARLAAQG